MAHVGVKPARREIVALGAHFSFPSSSWPDRGGRRRIGGGATAAFDKRVTGNAIDGTEESDGNRRSQPCFSYRVRRIITVDLALGCEE